MIADPDLVLVARLAGDMAIAVMPVHGQYLARGPVADLDIDRLTGQRRQGEYEAQGGEDPQSLEIHFSAPA